MSNRIVVVIYGGNVQDILVDDPSVEVTILDHDTEGCEDSELVVVPGGVGEVDCEARVFELSTVTDPHSISRIRRAAGFPVPDQVEPKNDQFFG